MDGFSVGVAVDERHLRDFGHILMRLLTRVSQIDYYPQLVAFSNELFAVPREAVVLFRHAGGTVFAVEVPGELEASEPQVVQQLQVVRVLERVGPLQRDQKSGPSPRHDLPDIGRFPKDGYRAGV